MVQNLILKFSEDEKIILPYLGCRPLLVNSKRTRSYIVSSFSICPSKLSFHLIYSFKDTFFHNKPPDFC